MTAAAAGRAGRAVPAGVRRPAARAGPGAARRAAAGAAAGGGLDSGSGRFRGENPLGLGEATRAMEELGRLDALAEQLSPVLPGRPLEDIDLDALEAAARRAGPGRRPRAGRAGARAAPAGPVRAGAGRLAAAVAEGAAAAGRVGAARRRRPARRPPRRARDPPLRGRRRADRRHPAVGVRRHRALGRAADPDATPRCAAPPATRAGSTSPTSRSSRPSSATRAAVALCVDTSWSMVQDGRWVPMKRTALALHQLISTRFRGDALKLITFGRHARDGASWAS